MIKGDLRCPFANPTTLPIWSAMPWVDAEIEIPILAVRRTVTLLTDSGADGTVLNVRDAVQMLGKQDYRKLRKVGTSSISIGVGGHATYYSVEAKIVFQRSDGLLEGYRFDLRVAKPARKGSKRLAAQLKIPSLLGRDILCQFRMVMDYSKNELSLDH
jgi:hypothetical protein